jgi:hypothetical protein
LYGSLRASSRDFVELAADEALGGENRVARIGDRLPLGGLTDEALARSW